MFGLETYRKRSAKAKIFDKISNWRICWRILLSEPEAGSDATSQATTAETKEIIMLLTEQKTGSPVVDAQTSIWSLHKPTEKKDTKELMLLLLKKEQQVFTIGPKEDKLGIRGSRYTYLTI